MFVIGLIAAMIQGGLIRRLVPRFGETRLIIMGPLFLGLSFTIIGLADTWAVVIAGCALMPFGFGLNNPALQGILSRIAPAEHQGSYLGLNQSLGSLARVVGPVMAGLLFQFGHAGLPFLAGAGTLFVATIIAYTYHRRFAGLFTRKGESSA
jgi:DHA1 family tetracycline resistance protein-like MFS transporter